MKRIFRCKTVWNFIALISFKWSVWRKQLQCKCDDFIKQSAVVTNQERRKKCFMIWSNPKLIWKISKRWRYKVLHRWNVLWTEWRRAFSEVICARVWLISLAANVRERLRRQICVNPLVWTFSLCFNTDQEKYANCHAEIIRLLEYFEH